MRQGGDEQVFWLPRLRREESALGDALMRKGGDEQVFWLPHLRREESAFVVGLVAAVSLV